MEAFTVFIYAPLRVPLLRKFGHRKRGERVDAEGFRC